jgi:hypothetical protein
LSTRVHTFEQKNEKEIKVIVICILDYDEISQVGFRQVVVFIGDRYITLENDCGFSRQCQIFLFLIFLSRSFSDNGYIDIQLIGQCFFSDRKLGAVCDVSSVFLTVIEHHRKEKCIYVGEKKERKKRRKENSLLLSLVFFALT